MKVTFSTPLNCIYGILDPLKEVTDVTNEFVTCNKPGSFLCNICQRNEMKTKFVCSTIQAMSYHFSKSHTDVLPNRERCRMYFVGEPVICKLCGYLESNHQHQSFHLLTQHSAELHRQEAKEISYQFEQEELLKQETRKARMKAAKEAKINHRQAKECGKCYKAVQMG